MGIMDTEGNTGKQAPRGSNIVPTTMPPWLQHDGDAAGSGITWDDADPRELKDALTRVTRHGAAFSASESRDHHTVSVTVLDGPDKPKFYASTRIELSSLLRRLAGTL